MNELIISVNDEKLSHFSEYVKAFQKDTMADCEELKCAIRKLKSNSSDQEIYESERMVDKIVDIIADDQPTITQLSKKIDEYVALVRRLKAVARS